MHYGCHLQHKYYGRGEHKELWKGREMKHRKMLGNTSQRNSTAENKVRELQVKYEPAMWCQTQEKVCKCRVKSMEIITVLHSSCRGPWRLEVCAGLGVCLLRSPRSEEAVRENSRNQRFRKWDLWTEVQIAGWFWSYPRKFKWNVCLLIWKGL